MKSWHLPTNLSAQIGPDYISEYLNFQNFRGWHVAPPSISRLGLSLWALTCPYCTPPSPPQYIPPRLTNKKWLGTPLSVQCRFVLLLVLNFAGFFFLRFQQANMKKKALNSRFKHFELFRLSLEKLDLYRDDKMSIIRNFMDFL